jgi:hypothetical protein
MKLLYFIKRFGYNALPSSFFKGNYKRLKAFEESCDQSELRNRLDYYFKVHNHFELPQSAVAVKDFRKTVGTDYYLDLKDFLQYFNPEVRFAYHFGDETHVNASPTLFKARPIEYDNANSILFKLNKKRHFRWVEDKYSFTDKRNGLVWRGGAYQANRKLLVEKFWNQPRFNVGQTNKPKEKLPWQKPFLSTAEQLKYKFVACPEGNDVATNLKWVMSSNSLAVMPKPRYETWFMEGILEPDVHYVAVENDYSNLEEKMEYYSNRPVEANKIIHNAHLHVARFRNPDLEDLLCLKVLEQYAELSGQEDANRFELD